MIERYKVYPMIVKLKDTKSHKAYETRFEDSGVLVQVNENKRTEENYFTKIALKNKVLKKVHRSELLIRFVASTIVSLLLTLIVLPILNYNIKEAFAITYLPTSLLKLISIILFSLSFIMVFLVSLSSKYKIKKKNCK